MITCLAWVKRGAAKEKPDRVTLSKDELKEVIDDARERLREKQEQDSQDKNVEKTKKEKDNQDTDELEEDDIEEILNEYDLDNYDDADGIRMEGAGMAGLSYYSTNEEDPYVLIKDELDEDKDDFTIKNTDNLVVTGHVEDDYSTLQIILWNEEEDNYYVNHEILLDSFPLTLEWMDFDPGSDSPGNFVAVGTMEPFINIWDLDVIDGLEAAATLGKRKRRKNKKKNKPSDDVGHDSAVLDLSWNQNIRNVLASGSADSTVILWDVAQAKAVHVLNHHKDKVQSLEFHPFEPQSLLTGSLDKRVKCVDCRSPESNIKQWKFNGEIEKVVWDQFSPFNFLTSTDNGYVYLCDVRTDSPLFTLQAHDAAVGGLALSSQVPGCLLTASADASVKIWDIKDNKPSLILSREMQMGHILNASCCPDTPFTFAMGGEKQGLQLFNIMESAPVRRHFEGRERLARVTNTTKQIPAEPDDINSNEESANDNEEIKEEPMEEEAATASAMAQLSIGKKKKKKKRK